MNSGIDRLSALPSALRTPYLSRGRVKGVRPLFFAQKIMFKYFTYLVSFDYDYLRLLFIMLFFTENPGSVPNFSVEKTLSHVIAQ